MDWILIWAIFTTITSIILIYVMVNLIKKNEKQEDILIQYNSYLNKISDVIEISDRRLKDIDSRGLFSSDDEIGFFFKTIKNVQEILNSFKIKNL